MLRYFRQKNQTSYQVFLPATFNIYVKNIILGEISILGENTFKTREMSIDILVDSVYLHILSIY